VDDQKTTVAVQRYLDELAGVQGSAPAEPIVRALLARSVDRLRILCQSMLYRSYPRLTRGPLNLDADELLSAIVERLIKAMREVRPGTVRQFFALANQHMRWELNDLARRLDTRMHAAELHESAAVAPEPSPSPSGVTANTQRILQAIDDLPEEEREVFNLVRIQGMTKAEAAGILGCSEKTIQRRVSRCLVRLTEVLGDMVPSVPQGDIGGDASAPAWPTV
jgi:RNA polymerase sigma-70 factor (ECF subfamily)